jgi:hypothetical protein
MTTWLHRTIAARRTLRTAPLLIAALLMTLGRPFSASAASVNFLLDLSIDNHWKVFVDVSDNDNFGIAGYSFRFVGNTLTHDHASPRAALPTSETIEVDFDKNGQVNAADYVVWRKLHPDQEATYEDFVERFGEFHGNFEPAGFSMLRSQDNTNSATTESNITVAAFQDTFTEPNPHLIYGFGQQASSFVLEGITPGGVNEQPEWSEPLLLAQGTYNRAAGTLAFDTASVQTFVNVFTAPDNPNDDFNPPVALIPNANESFIHIPFTVESPDAALVPEPSAVASCFFAILFMAGRARRR